jgi:hypothetical protein
MAWLIDIEGIRGAFPGGHPATPSLSSAAAATPAADSVDRISALPDVLLRDVVSRVPPPRPRRRAHRRACLPLARPLARRALVLRDADLLLASDGERASPDAAVGRILADHPGPFRNFNLPLLSYIR